MKNAKIVIIGAVAAGTKAAAKLRRELPDTKITIVTREKDISYAGCGLPYFIGGVIGEREKLISRTPEQLKNTLNLDVLTEHDAIDADIAAKTVTVLNLRTKENIELPYDVLVIATGARPFGPPVEGINLKNIFTLRNIEDAEAIKAAADSGHKKPLIIGGGYIGLEVAENFIHRGIRPTIIETLPHILPLFEDEIALLVEKHVRSKGVEVVTGAKVIKFIGNEKGEVIAAETDKGRRIEADLVLWSTGVRPNVDFAKKCRVEIGETGAIRVNKRMQTNVPGIFAVGDCAETFHRISRKPVWIPLGSTANKMGRIAAMNIAGHSDEMEGVLGSAIVKVFDMNVGRTGLASHEAHNEGHDIETVVMSGFDAAHYYPTAKLVTIKMIVDKKTRRVLGLQAVGEGMVDKPLDVAVALISLNGTVDDLAKMDFAYAPPYSSAMSIAITAANVMQNKLSGRMHSISPVEYKDMKGKGADVQYLDVRSRDEFEKSRIAEAINIPWGELKDRMGELDRDRQTIVGCKLGRSAYGAYLTLRNKGFTNIQVCEGGMTAYPFETKEAKK